MTVDQFPVKQHRLEIELLFLLAFFFVYSCDSNREQEGNQLWFSSWNARWLYGLLSQVKELHQNWLNEWSALRFVSFRDHQYNCNASHFLRCLDFVSQLSSGWFRERNYTKKTVMTRLQSSLLSNCFLSQILFHLSVKCVCVAEKGERRENIVSKTKKYLLFFLGKATSLLKLSVYVSAWVFFFGRDDNQSNLVSPVLFLEGKLTL